MPSSATVHSVSPSAACITIASRLPSGDQLALAKRAPAGSATAVRRPVATSCNVIAFSHWVRTSAWPFVAGSMRKPPSRRIGLDIAAIVGRFSRPTIAIVRWSGDTSTAGVVGASRMAAIAAGAR